MIQTVKFFGLTVFLYPTLINVYSIQTAPINLAAVFLCISSMFCAVCRKTKLFYCRYYFKYYFYVIEINN